MRTIIQNKHKMNSLLEMHRELVYCTSRNKCLGNYLYLTEIKGKTVIGIFLSELSLGLWMQDIPILPIGYLRLSLWSSQLLESWQSVIYLQDSGKSLDILKALLDLQDDLMPCFSRAIRKRFEKRLWRELEEEEWKKRRPADMEMLLQVIASERQKEIEKKKKDSNKLLWLSALEEMAACFEE